MSLFHRADQGDKFGCGHLVRHFGLTPPRMRISRSFCASPRLFYKRPCWFLSRQLAWHRCSQVVDAAFRCQEVFHLIGVSDVALPWFTGKKKTNLLSTCSADDNTAISEILLFNLFSWLLVFAVFCMLPSHESGRYTNWHRQCRHSQ